MYFIGILLDSKRETVTQMEDLELQCMTQSGVNPPHFWGWIEFPNDLQCIWWTLCMHNHSWEWNGMALGVKGLPIVLMTTGA